MCLCVISATRDTCGGARGRCVVCLCDLCALCCTPAVGMRALCAKETMKLVKKPGKEESKHIKTKSRTATGCREGRVVYGHSESDSYVSQRARARCSESRDRECFAPAQSANISRCDADHETRLISASRKTGAR